MIKMKRITLFSATMIVSLIVACFPCMSYARNAHYKGFADVGYSTCNGNYGFKQVFVNTTHGVSMLSDRLFVGAGVGIGSSIDSNIEDVYTLPIYAASRYTLNKYEVKPFVDLKIGYAGMWNEDTDGGGDLNGGFYLAPSLGISTTEGKIGLNIAAGYSVVRAKYEENLEPLFITDKFNAGGLFLTLGISF
jgi:hypothetical protein